MSLIAQGKNNWKFILIVVVLTIFAIAEILIHISDFNSDLTFLSFLSGEQRPEKNIGNKVACTMDAKLCPDGSYVGRTGPNCEFAACSVNNLNCEESSKYFVMSKNSDILSDFLVKYKTSKDQFILCSYVVEETDFELKDQAATYFLALTDNFLILDSGTAPDPRGLTVYDLNSRKKVYTDTYSKPISTLKDVITYWNPTEEKATNENCPNLRQYLAGGLGAGIEALVSLDLSHLTKKELGEYRCSPRQ